MGSGGSKTTEASSPPKKAPPKLSEIEQGQITLMRQRDRLLKLEKTIENDIKICIEKAKAAKRNNHTDAAIRYVKLKLIKEKRRNDINAQIYNLETINLKIQEASTNADTFRAMEAGNKVIQAIQTELPIERAQRNRLWKIPRMHSSTWTKLNAYLTEKLVVQRWMRMP